MIVLEELESLCHPLRDIRRLYHESIEPYRQSLWSYAYRLTGSAWDAEDLVQETLLRAFASLPKLWQPLFPRAYLFRIATNFWINECRKRHIDVDSYSEEDGFVDQDSDPFVVREAIAALAGMLPPRQAAVVLLIEAFVDAFNQRDADGIARLLNVEAVNDIVHVAEEIGRETIRKDSLTGWANDPLPMKGEYGVLWGKPVVIVTTKSEEIEQLYTIIELSLSLEGNEIMSKRDYYFCQDLLIKAGESLQLPVHLNGYIHS
jgi:RNA polymerase sigma-70 factor (ECF subfamily)